MKDNTRTLFIALLIFLVGSAVAITAVDALGIDNTAPSQAEQIKLLNARIAEQEIIMSLAIPECNKLSEAKAEKATLESQKGKLVHGDFKPEPTPQKTVEAVIPRTETTAVESPNVSLDKIALAVAYAETSNCTKGKGVSNNNCHGIRNGKIAPCKKMDAGRFCIYESTDESFEAFKKIWQEGYGGGYPTYGMAATWTGNDRPDTWLANFKHYYYN